MARGEVLALIAAEFPGQFPGIELFNLDIRDENFFAQEASRLRVLRKIELYEGIRIAMWSESKDFQRIIGELYQQINETDRMDDEKINTNWEFFKIKKRG